MKNGIFKDKYGHIAYRHNGIKYSVYEGVTMEGKPTTSDIAFIVLDTYEDVVTYYITYSYGATDFVNNIGQELAWLNADLREWEDSHKDVVSRIWEGEVEEI